MFDRTYIHAPQAPASPQEVHEHRAPTDESIQLLREMEDKLQQNVLQVVVSNKNNILEGREHILIGSFQLNGQTYTFQHPIHGPDSLLLRPEDLVGKLVEAISLEVTRQVLSRMEGGESLFRYCRK